MRMRPVIGLGVFLAAAVIVFQGSTAPNPNASFKEQADSMTEPIVISSVPRMVNGELIGILDAAVEVVLDTIVPPGTTGKQVVRAYRLTYANGQPYDVTSAPGPTWLVHPGDSVRILLTNKLPADPSPHHCIAYGATTQNPPLDTFPNCFHGSNTTNIHYHGMHVTPSGTGDNVLLEIGPDSSFQFAFRIPMNQSPGTHWYHPHKHGAVALQVTNGMSGALIVQGGALDSLTESLKMVEHMIAVQQIDSQVNLVGTNVGSVKLINGQANPKIYMRPGEVQRWRLVNENVSTTTTFSLVFQPSNPGQTTPALFDIARDGVQYAPQNYSAAAPDTNLIVAPGNRLDMFVRAPQAVGTHQLNAELIRQPGARVELPGAQLKAGVTQPLLTVVVQDGPPRNTVLPATLPPLPPFLANLAATPDTSHSLVFSEIGTPGSGVPPSFFLGTWTDSLMKFNPDVPFVTAPLGATQTWLVTNRSQKINHPFHIHVNPFQVIRVNYKAGDGNAPLYDQMNAAAAGGYPIWMDTFALPTNGGSIVVRQRYDDFTGKYVMHCHVLGHEERGMMQLVEITGYTSKGR